MIKLEVVLDANTLSILLLVVVPLLFALAVGVVFWYVRVWRREIHQALQLSARDLQEARSQVFDLRKTQAEFSQMHRLPYADMARELLKTIDAVEKSAVELEKTWQELEARRKAVPGMQIRAVIRAFPDTYGQAKFVALLERQRAQLQECLQKGSRAVSSMHSVPAEQVAEAFKALEGIEELEGLLGEMHQEGLHGRKMDEADETLLRLQQTRLHFPADFNEPGEVGVQHQTASDLFDLLSSMRPLLAEWLPRVRSWQRQYQRAIGSYARLQKTSTNFRAALALPPPVLIINRFQASLLQVAASANELNGRLGSAEVQALRGLYAEISYLEQVLQMAVAQYDQAVRQVGELDHLLLELEADFKLLAARLADAEIQEVYPLSWDVSYPLKADLQEKIAALGSRELKRAPEQVASTLLDGTELLKRLTTLLARTDEQVERCNDLLSLLFSPDLAEGADWVRRAGVLAREVAVYDPANWGKADEIPSLNRDVAALEEWQRKLVPLDRPASIRESGLAKRLEDTRALAGLHQRMRPRVEQVRARLSELRQSDRDTRDSLERLTNTLDQLGLLLNGNSYLREVAAVDLSRLRGEAGRLKEDLSRPEVGPLDKKMARLSALIEAVMRAGSVWLDRLSANTQLHTAAIGETLAALDALVQLDDREVSDARELLRRVGAAQANPRPSNTMDAAAALKRSASDWQTAASCAAALEQFAAPVLSTAREAEQSRRSVKAVLQSTPKLSSGRRDWPPVRPALENDAAEFHKLEARLDGLRGQRWSASRLVREMGLIYHELDKLDEHATQALRAAEGERGAVQDLERRVAELTRKLEGFTQRYPDQRAVVDGARDLSTQAEQRLAYLRAQYRRGGVDYDQTLTALAELETSLRAARFKTEDGRSISVEDRF